MSIFENNYRKWHTKLSYTKSFIRILSCFGVIIDRADGLYILALGLLLAEIIGITEEWV
jgi:hypothetical protein